MSIWNFNEELKKSLGEFLILAARAGSDCPLTSPPKEATGERMAQFYFGRLPCGCRCGKLIADCACEKPRGGREMRETLLRLLEEKEYDSWQVAQIVAWKYKVELRRGR